MPDPSVTEKEMAASENDLRAMLQENLALTRAILDKAERTRRYILFGQIAGVIKIILVVAPLIAGVIYLGPLLKQAMSAYQGLLGGGAGEGVLPGSNPWGTILQNKLEEMQNREMGE